jgi:presenilin 1
MLGLGDFVFYGALLGRAALINYQTLITSTFAVLMGLAVTILLTTRSTKALPALPLSIACGLLFYGLTSPLIIPMCNRIASLGAAL